jgi:hypothetical protein
MDYEERRTDQRHPARAPRDKPDHCAPRAAIVVLREGRGESDDNLSLHPKCSVLVAWIAGLE